MTYDYKCDACNNTYTVERGIRDEEIAPVCVDCHQTMSRVWSVATFIPSPGMYSYENKR